MFRNRIWRWLRMAAFAAAVSTAFSNLASAQDRDDYYYNRHEEAREHGYRNGVADGERAGQRDAERGRRFNFKNDDWEDSRGYEHWMGSKGEYKHAYRWGYEEGYRRAYAYNDRYRNRDDYRWRDRDDWR
jgi:hypothetical protein